MQIWVALEGGKLEDITACPKGEIKGEQKKFLKCIRHLLALSVTWKDWKLLRESNLDEYID